MVHIRTVGSLSGKPQRNVGSQVFVHAIFERVGRDHGPRRIAEVQVFHVVHLTRSTIGRDCTCSTRWHDTCSTRWHDTCSTRWHEARATPGGVFDGSAFVSRLTRADDQRS